jgi:hypothetical protein
MQYLAGGWSAEQREAFHQLVDAVARADHADRVVVQISWPACGDGVEVLVVDPGALRGGGLPPGGAAA